MPKKSHAELFIIEPAVVTACSMEEVRATYDDLVEMGLARLPFDDFDLRYAPAIWGYTVDRDLADWTFEGDNAGPRMIQTCYRNGRQVDLQTVLSNGMTETMIPGGMNYEQFAAELRRAFTEKYQEEGKQYEDVVSEDRPGVEKLFVVLLATKNIVKHRTEDKLWKLGIGKKKRHRYTTVLRLPAECDLVHDAEHSTGSKKRPHLRRGHIRNQRYGANFAFVKKVWIEPVFIHADENFVSSRTAYVIRQD